ncbi:MAG: amidohydrolase family protein [Woeseiaceae bacterium]|nr:amidohydrolase family protein [Woeseiaceae bacterium]
MLKITNVTAVTMDAERRVIEDAALVIDGRKIAAIGRDTELSHRYSDVPLLDGGQMIALPGLIDTHAHADQSLLRGLGDRLHWMPFLDDIVEPYLQRRDPVDGVLANQLSMVEMLRSGTTTFVSPNVDPRDDFGALTAAIAELGIRAVLGRFIEPQPGEDSRRTARRTVEKALGVMRRWDNSEDGLVRLWFGLDVPRRAGDTEHPRFYEAVAQASRETGMGIVYHFCSEIEDAEYIEATYGCRPAEWSRDNHVLGPNVLLINGCWVSPLEIEILAETGTHLAHSPVANMKMATGILPVRSALECGVNVSLGTDGALNNNSFDMFGEMKTACLLQNSACRDAAALSAESALEMATIRGAAAIGRTHELGSLEPGKLADVVLIDRRDAVPIHNIASNLVFCCNRANVHTVFVNGRKVVADGRVVGLDEQELALAAQSRAESIRRQLKLSTGAAWPIIAPNKPGQH